MPFKLSRCVCLQLPDLDRALRFYRDVMGLEEAGREGGGVELKAGPFRLFLDRGPSLGPILEFLVPDLEAARRQLLQAGCQVVRWEGRGGCCYLCDPFGLVFNLYEEPEAFKGPEAFKEPEASPR